MTELILLNADPASVERYLSAGADEVVLSMKKGILSAGMPEGKHISFQLADFYYPGEEEELGNILGLLDSRDFSSLYFSDPAIYMRAGEKLRKKMIYMPETLMTNSADANWWLDLGIKSVVVSALLTKEETEDIIGKCPGSEIRIHGHLPLSHSRRMLLSAFDAGWHEKENLFLQEEKREERMPVFENDAGTRIYSAQVLESFRELTSFRTAGAERFEIDSLFLQEEEILDAIAAYRKILNGADGEEVRAEYRKLHPETPLFSGFYREKTVK